MDQQKLNIFSFSLRMQLMTNNEKYQIAHRNLDWN